MPFGRFRDRLFEVPNRLPDPLGERFESAELLSVDEKDFEIKPRHGVESTTRMAIATLTLTDGKKFRSTNLVPFPKVGDKLSIRATNYSNGTTPAAISAQSYQ